MCTQTEYLGQGQGYGLRCPYLKGYLGMLTELSQSSFLQTCYHIGMWAQANIRYIYAARVANPLHGVDGTCSMGSSLTYIHCNSLVCRRFSQARIY